MNNLINSANTFNELQDAMKNIYESSRRNKKSNRPHNHLERLFQSCTNEQIKKDMSLSQLQAIDELISILKEYEEDLFYRGSLKANKTQRNCNEHYNSLQTKFILDCYRRVTDEDLKIFQTKLQIQLTHVIQTTQLHLIFVDSEPELGKAKSICNKYMSLSTLGNILISYNSTADFQKILQTYKTLPSIYIFFGESDMRGNIMNLISSHLPKITQLKDKKLIEKCFVTEINETNPQRQALNNNPLFSFETETNLFQRIQNWVNQFPVTQVFDF